MKKIIIHLSDLHFRKNWEEDQGFVLDAFFKDLQKQVEQTIISNVYIAFSGDIVLAGKDPELYKDFFNQFEAELSRLKIPKIQRIFVPGNHDVSDEFIESNAVEHEGIVIQNLKEKDFNDYIQKTKPNILKDKFKNYEEFEKKFAHYGVSKDILSGVGWDIGDGIGIYCLNSAICSSGGYNDINDKERLAIYTRGIYKWISNNKDKIKILIMHHPLRWLKKWAQPVLTNLLRNEFSLCLSGHVHNQAIFYSINKEHSLVECSAPPLLTNKDGDLGYALISVSNKGVLNIQYRQWTKKNTFVTGVNFSDTDDGKIVIKKSSNDDKSKEAITRILENNLDNALRSFSSQPIIWVEPILCNRSELSKDIDDNTNQPINLTDFISNPKSTIIKAPPQFGLTCLAHRIAKEAWENDSFLWLYLNCNTIKSLNRLDRIVKKSTNALGVEKRNINGIILDSWTTVEKYFVKILHSLSDTYKNIPIIVMQTTDNMGLANEDEKETIDREFDILFLHSLPRTHIRKAISVYNNKVHIGEEDAVVEKIVSDLHLLNIHRTPLNCLTLLKVFEKYFDESPVNRTKMIEMILFLLFNVDALPTYKSRPDLKDCEYVLGRFCEKMIRNGVYHFDRDEFTRELEAVCSEKLIDLEIDVVFDVLHANQIVVRQNGQFCFRFSYWISYFAAQRMHHNKEFAEYILGEKRYVSFPEMIEFYTGIDRRREDALEILIKDLRETCDAVRDKVGLPDDMNPFELLKWSPDEDSFKKIKDEIRNDVTSSNLPTAVKDQYADVEYNKIKPYDQSIHEVINEFSLPLLVQNTKAAARALRNSDYVNSNIKFELLTEIVRSWEEYSKFFLFYHLYLP